MNEATVKFIVDNDLISVDGQQNYVDKGGVIDFPRESIELKAVWLKISKEQQFSYLSRPDPFDDDQLWGLVSLHITTKDIPNWYWATFEHEDNYKSGAAKFQPTDKWGFSGEKPTAGLEKLLIEYKLDPSIWSHYRLSGSQVEYIDTIGEAIIRGNNRIEGGLEPEPEKRSSCMTCHVRSAVGNKLSFKLEEFKAGAPKPGWFIDNQTGGKIHLRDFVWALARAKHRSKPPESILNGLMPGVSLQFLADILPLIRTADIKELKTRGIEVHKKSEVLKHFSEIRDYMKEEDPKLNKPRWSSYLVTQFEDWNKAQVALAKSSENTPQSPNKS